MLANLYEQAIVPTDSIFKKKFFNCFPNDFSLFNSLYGWYEKGDTLYVQPLYDDAINHINLFCELYNYIASKDYYKKCIDISLDGHWSADAVNYFQTCVQNHITNNTLSFLEVLDTYNDIDIKKFWHFVFDTSYYNHPSAKSIHQIVYNKVKILNPRILVLMEEQYNQDYETYLEKEDNVLRR
jgi:hypothetical protein